MNYCTFIGRICNELEVKETSNGKKYLKFYIAVRNGKDKTDFIPCTIFDKGAEIVNQYASKGSLISVSGKLHTTSVEKDGKKTVFYDVMVSEFDFLETKKSGTSNNAPSPVGKPPIDAPTEDEYDVPFEM